MSSTVILAAMPVLLALASALLFVRNVSDHNARFVVSAGVVVTGILLLVNFPSAVAGTTTQLSLPDPLPGVASGLAANSSGYLVLGLSLVAALVVAFNGIGRYSAAWLMLGLAGVALACLSVGMLGLVVGAELVWLAIFAHARIGGNDRSISAERWLGVVVLQVAAAALLASTVWVEAQAQTTAFNAMPAASAARCALGWALAIVLLTLSGGLGRGDNSRPDDLGWATALLSPLVLINLIRINQVVTPHLSTQAAVVLIAGGIVCGVLGAIRALIAATPGSAIRWLWVATAAPLLVLGGLQIPGSGIAFTACAIGFMLSGILLTVAAHYSAGPYIRAACLLGACGFPTGAALAGWITGVVVLVNHGPSMALGWVLLAVSTVMLMAAVKIAITETTNPTIPVSRKAGLAVLSLSAAAGLVPGFVASSMSGWLLDQNAGAGPLMTVNLANGAVWPGGWVALASLLLIAAIISAWVVAGWRTPRPLLAASIDDSAQNLRSGLAAWESAVRPLRVMVEAVARLDQWLALEPRFGTILVSGALAVTFFR